MSLKANTPLSDLFSLLESKYTLRLCWALKDGHPQNFRLLQDSMGGVTPNTLNARTKELRAAGLLAHGKSGYFLTPLGIHLTRLLVELPSFAQKWTEEITIKTNMTQLP